MLRYGGRTKVFWTLILLTVWLDWDLAVGISECNSSPNYKYNRDHNSKKCSQPNTSFPPKFFAKKENSPRISSASPSEETFGLFVRQLEEYIKPCQKAQGFSYLLLPRIAFS